MHAQKIDLRLKQFLTISKVFYATGSKTHQHIRFALGLESLIAVSRMMLSLIFFSKSLSTPSWAQSRLFSLSIYCMTSRWYCEDVFTLWFRCGHVSVWQSLTCVGRWCTAEGRQLFLHQPNKLKTCVHNKSTTSPFFLKLHQNNQILHTECILGTNISCYSCLFSLLSIISNTQDISGIPFCELN